MRDIVKYTLTHLVGYALGCLALAPVVTHRALLYAQQPPRAFSPAYDPVRDLGALFRDVQLGSVFPDSKTFVDSKPRLAPAVIVQRYAAEKGKPRFSLSEFVTRHFDVPRAAASAPTDRAALMEQHITALWPMLTRTPDTSKALSTLLPLPFPYVVPGGRFREVYYWDSYFTMLGLVQSKRVDLVKSMLDNFAHLITTVGHMPNGNRVYYLGRSQPPFFAAMVGLYAEATDSAQALRYIDAMRREHEFWMDGALQVKPGSAWRRVVRLADGTLLNRYYDDLPGPRPESYREDSKLADGVSATARPALFTNLRAAAESGWDFSTRWMRDPNDLRTIETIELAPVDLNSLMYHAERTLAALLVRRGGAGDAAESKKFAATAASRLVAIRKYAFDAQDGYFYDVRWRTGMPERARPTMAAAAPLYFRVATAEQGRAVATRLERDFLRSGGFVTTLVKSGQQWDAPNGWAPLEWMAIEGVRRYGRADLANTARDRWLALNRRTYAATGKMMEKYDVSDASRPAGGGEYPTQDGFGWSNGVALALVGAGGVSTKR